MIDAIKNFVERWKERGNEKSDAQSFWLDLIHALGIDEPANSIQFEVPVNLDGANAYIDAFIPSTKVLIENKSRGIDLDKPARQSDGKFLTPFEQAKRYADARAYSQRPRWIVICNFVELRVYDMDRYYQQEIYAPNAILIERLAHEFSRLNFLIDPDDENVNPALKISKQAGELVGLIYRSFEGSPPTLPPTKLGAQPVTQSPPRAVDALWAGLINKLCVRLVFCFYADDAFIFERNQFNEYMRQAPDRRTALIELFDVLNTPEDRRNPDLRAELKKFPYVNGDLFDSADPIPKFSIETEHWLLSSAHDFNWSGISPTIFGALFESTLNPVTRRRGGMHYTSIENIHKVIDPLFLDDLHEEFKTVKRKRKNKKIELEKFQFKLAALTFFDPACGSGNFLTETFLSLRRLENDVIRELYKLGARCRIRISIENFFGIEINDFAVAVARTALWIAENQMLQETEMIIHENINFLPLKSAAHIVCGNALRLDWHDIVPDGVDYIIGNPPFRGYNFHSTEQKADLLAVTRLNNKKIDYVAGWFYKAAAFMVDSDTRAAFVATNSICQGEQTPLIWKKLFETVHIDFAHRPFKWLSESEDMAAVHCVIIGFSAASNDKRKIIFDGDRKIVAENINAYLFDGPNFFVEKRKKPLCDVPKMTKGSQPTDGLNLIIEAKDYDAFIQREPRAKKFIHRFMGAEEFINGKPRYCLWLVDANEDDLKLPLIAQRIEGCRRSRLKSKKAATQRDAATPHLFQEIRQPSTNFIVVPRISSEHRKYIPMDFIDPSVIPGDLVQIIPDADLFHFGVLNSTVHMAWTKTFCGRLELRYIYSGTIVYNNFPWCARSARIEQTAQGILDARSQYPSWTLAALYDEQKMPPELRAAHEENDRAVLAVYGFDGDMTEAEIVSRLMAMYKRLAEKND